jgi:hypothetical protein
VIESTAPKGGDRFGRLTCLRVVGRANDGHKLWECRCDCGTICNKQSNNLPRAVSCGCAAGEKARTHGMRHFKEYRQWCGAKARCYTLSNKDYAKYGGRGIKMCDAWRESFEAFYASMGACPHGRSLDRINTNGYYAPDNCRWATRSQQQQNKRTSYQWFIKGLEFNSIMEASQHFGVSLPTIVRWCEGYFDKRRDHQRGPLPDCHRESRY